jgi:hypothetical protein
MKKYVVLSVNDNPDYLFHVPLVVWAWRKLGWEPILFFHGKRNKLSGLIGDTFELLHRDMTTEMKFLYSLAVYDLDPTEYHSETITQVSRLYGTCVADGYLMTGDIDMLPLSDYWKPEMNQLTVYGRDLTDYHYPICYIGAHSRIWSEIMKINHDDYNEYIKRDLDSMPQAKSSDKTKRWVTDQDLITERINNSSYVPVRIDRGTDKRTGYPIGRIDRSHWTLEHKEYIDCHMYHGIQSDENKFKVTLKMLHTVWPKENWSWWINYYKEFKKICQK